MRCTHLQRTAALALASTCLSTQAFAQNAGTETLPPVRQQLDENGVDVARGTQVNYSAELSIGPDDPGGLKLIRGRGPGVETSNYHFYLVGTMESPSIRVSAGLRTIVFNNAGGLLTPTDGSGATLVQSGSNFMLTLENGTVILFEHKGDLGSDVKRGTSVTFANGQKLGRELINRIHIRAEF